MTITDTEWEPPDELERQAQAEADLPPAKLRAVPDKITLYSTDAERALLGAALRSSAARDTLATLTPDDFGLPSHQLIASAITAIHADGHPADVVTVAEHLRQLGQLELAGGPGALIALQAGTPSTTSAPRYAAIVSELATTRAIGAYGQELAAATQAPGTNLNSLLADAQARLDTITDRLQVADSHLHPLADLAADYLDTVEARDATDLVGVTTGLRELDGITGGLQGGHLYTIAGRPGMGKSDIGVHLAISAADAGHTVLVVSIEMGNSEVIDRIVSHDSRTPATRISHGQLSPVDWERIAPAIAELPRRPIWIDDNPGTTMASIRSSVRRSQADVVIVDYIQIVDTPKAENRQLEVSGLARALKRLAREMDVPVVALAQLNRGLEGRLDKRPILSDLRESGAIEQESHVVIGLYRDERYHPDTKDRGVMELIALKNRTGPNSTVRVGYLADIKRITNLAKDT